MDKQTGGLYKGILLNNAKEWTTYSDDSMNESQKQYREEKKPYKKGIHCMYDSIYTKS